MKGSGQRGLALTGDVTKADDLAAAISTLEKELGPLSVAANCAGVADAAPAEEMALAQWQRVFDINVTGVFLSCQAEARVMLPRKQGSIVSIASMSGTIVNRGILQVHYNASKAAVMHLYEKPCDGMERLRHTCEHDKSGLYGNTDESAAGSC